MRTTLAMMLAGLLAAGVWVLIEPPSRGPAGEAKSMDQAAGPSTAAPLHPEDAAETARSRVEATSTWS